MSQASAPTARWVAIGGAPLLTFLLALAGACLAWLLLGPAPWTERPAGPRRQERAPALRRRALPALAFAGAAGLALAGCLLPVDHAIPGGPAVAVAAIQGNVPHARDLPDLWRAAAVTQYHAEATQDLAAQVRAGSRPAPDVVIWPENSADLDPGRNPALSAVIRPPPTLSAGRCWSAPCCRTRGATRASCGCRAAAPSPSTSSASWYRSASTSRSAACCRTSRR